MPKRKQKSMKKDYHVTPEQFIRVWQTSETAEEAATRLGMPKPIVHARASEYRGMGITLKKMPRAKSPIIDIARLNTVIKQLDAK
jgi:hypothetical protein